METLKKLYEEKIVPNLTKKFNYTTKMQVPKLEKIVLNMGVGDAINDQKFLEVFFSTFLATFSFFASFSAFLSSTFTLEICTGASTSRIPPVSF